MDNNIFQQIKQSALQTLDIEASTVLGLKASINEDFVKCICHILKNKGRVVLTGIGKSAIIAQKIVATLNSTGTPALFMHAADAIHGDLGMIEAKDTVICLSKSGETAEIKVLVPLLKHQSHTLVALVGNRESYLARQADFVLHTPIVREACPHNLAPTASTTAQLAMGDALAVCILEMRRFSAADFAKVHPGGALGKKMYLRIGDVLSADAVPAVDLGAGIGAVIMEISSKRLGATAVIDFEQSRLLGVITDGDLRRILEKKNMADLDTLTAAEMMTLDPKTIQLDSLAIDALALVQLYKITQLFVLDGEKYVGIVHIHDLIREGLI